MDFDPIRKLATGSVLFSLDRIISPRLVRILYPLGLAGIVLWAISHFFATFRFGLGSGLWGLLEIAVFGLMAFVALRIVCEALIVYFKSHEREAEAATRPRPALSLIDEVRDAIEDLALEEETRAPAAPPPAPPPPAAAVTPPPVAEPPAPAPRKPAPRRTARRTPRPRAGGPTTGGEPG